MKADMTVFEDWTTIAGGLSRIIDVAAGLVGLENIVLNAPVMSIEESGVHLRITTRGVTSHQGISDKLLLAIPPAAINKLESRPTWSFLKEQAIRSVHEGASRALSLGSIKQRDTNAQYRSIVQTCLPLQAKVLGTS